MNNTFENRLKDTLRERWPETPPDPSAQARIRELLESVPRKYPSIKNKTSTPMRTVMGIAILILLLALLSLTLDSLPPAPAATQGSTVSPAETPTNAANTPQANDSFVSTALPAATAVSQDPNVERFPGVTWGFSDAFPPAPDSVTMYRQILGPVISEASSREMAARMGVEGDWISYPDEGGNMFFQVSDVERTMAFFGLDGQFTYFTIAPEDFRDPLPFADRVDAAETFLNERELLVFPYRAEQDPSNARGVRFVQLLDGLPLVYGLGMNRGLFEWITASVDADGVVTGLNHSLHDFQPVDVFPILTAADAWARFAGPAGENRAEYAVLAEPLVWTQLEVPLEVTLTGYLRMVGGVPELYTEDDRTLVVDAIPPDMPVEVVVQIRGVVSEGHVTWGEIFIGGPSNSYGRSWSCGAIASSGGGPFPDANFGGGRFAQISLDGTEVVAAPTPYDSSIHPGDLVDGNVGTIYMYTHIYPNGVQQLEVNFWYPGDQITTGWTGRLEMDDPASLTHLQNLPARLWGMVDRYDESGLPVIRVDRIEAVYPGVRIQAWLGSEEVVTLDGRDALLFTTDAGDQYVVGSSIDIGADEAIGTPGDPVILEGYILPDDFFGGYPVLTVLAGDPTIGSLGDYELQTTGIPIWDETITGQNQASALTGNVTINRVELAYAAISLERCSAEFLTYPGSESSLYVQPVWRFLGTFDDGRTIEILVQALPEEILK